MPYTFSKSAQNYKRRTFEKKYCESIAIDMTLNNMKVENQGISEAQFKAFIKKHG